MCTRRADGNLSSDEDGLHALDITANNLSVHSSHLLNPTILLFAFAHWKL
jgi:hypothetical protein